MLVALSVWAGVVLAPWGGLSPLAALLLLVAAGVVAVATGRRGALSLPGLAYGLCLVALTPAGPALEGEVAVEGVVVSAPSAGKARVEVRRWTRPGEGWRPSQGQVWVRFPEAPPPLGAQVILRGAARPYAVPVLPGAPDPVRGAARAGVQSELRARSAAQLGGDPIPGPDPFRDQEHRGLLRALALGDRAEVPEAESATLRRTGTSHLLAISGFHTGLVALLLGGAVRLPLRALALVYPRGAPDWPAWWVAAAGAGAFAWAAGAPVSAQRAAGMVALAALGRTLGLRPSLDQLLSVAAVAVLTADPASAVTPGFQLSFGAVLGIARVEPRLSRLIPLDLPLPLDRALRSVSVSLAATAGTLPAAAWWFQELAPLGPLANLFALPWSGLLVVPPALAAAWGPAALSPWAARLADLGVDGLLWGLSWADRPLLHPAAGPAAALILTAALLHPRAWTALPAAGLWAALSLPVSPRLPTLTFLDVGQGDAALIELPDGRRWLVDGGPAGASLARYLRRRGIRRLDRIYLSHGHPDHWGGLVAVVSELEVGALGGWDWEGAEPLVEAAAAAGVPRIRVAGVVPPPAEGGLNDRSLVLGVKLGGRRVLFTGDVERPGERALIARGLPPADVVKVPHHGSRSSSSQALVAALSPTLAVISAGNPSPFGHPHPEVVRRWEEAGALVLQTGRGGTVRLRLSQERIRAQRFSAGHGWSEALDLSEVPAGGPAPRATGRWLSAARRPLLLRAWGAATAAWRRGETARARGPEGGAR
ncbi:MAG: ComEC/Rec2 family competence protein [Deltaproteobacteria bacterium]|nr:ComEC/Rec2 family competence protein [Deltaproteobacteria bacterium]